MKLILIFLSLYALKTCDNTEKQSLNGSFQINTLSDSIITDYKLTFEFNIETKQITGFSGCNRFSGTYNVHENNLKIGPIASTRMYCDDSANKIEIKLLDYLSKVDSFKYDKGILSFLSNKKILIESVSAVKQNDTVSMEYSAHSKGIYNHIVINQKNISVENKRDTTPIIKLCSEANWDILLKALKPVDIENIPNLKAPSEKRFYDGAAIANLKIIYNGETYETPSFDHGNPPIEIAALVKEILSISENIE
jgi:heat shock protein HslJ